MLLQPVIQNTNGTRSHCFKLRPITATTTALSPQNATPPQLSTHPALHLSLNYARSFSSIDVKISQSLFTPATQTTLILASADRPSFRLPLCKLMAELFTFFLCHCCLVDFPNLYVCLILDVKRHTPISCLLVIFFKLLQIEYSIQTQ